MATTKAPKIAGDIIWRLLDDNIVVVSPKLGEVRVLNRTGAIIWQQLLAGKGTEEIEQQLVSQFQVSQENAREDLSVFLNELTEKGVIIWETAGTQ